ncbi:MAG: hypothetical protein OCD76_04720 [Reichenbachiella sp.]
MLKWRFAILEDADFNYHEDPTESMLDQLAAKLDKTRIELETVLTELQKQ